MINSISRHITPLILGEAGLEEAIRRVRRDKRRRGVGRRRHYHRVLTSVRESKYRWPLFVILPVVMTGGHRRPSIAYRARVSTGADLEVHSAVFCISSHSLRAMVSSFSSRLDIPLPWLECGWLALLNASVVPSGTFLSACIFQHSKLGCWWAMACTPLTSCAWMT